MQTLPDTVVAYKQTPEFTEATIPDGLRREHATNAGTWGLIHVVSGRLRLEFPADNASHELKPRCPGVVAPEQVHQVTAVGAVRFYVEFLR